MTKIQEDNFADYRERKSLIEKDVNRTDRTMDFYAGENNSNLQLLNDILMTYVMYNFDLGYVQGMSDLLSPILYLLRNEVDAFWCFVGFMRKVVRSLITVFFHSRKFVFILDLKFRFGSSRNERATTKHAHAVNVRRT